MTKVSGPVFSKLLRGALGVCLFLASAAFGAGYSVERLRCELAENPLGVDVGRPRLSWRVRSPEPGQRQTAWQVLIASTPEGLAAGIGDLWDSGRVVGSTTSLVPYGGRALAASQQVFWKVRSWDAEDRPSAWSDTATWTMGLLSSQDWTARWITAGGAPRLENTLLRREFRVGGGLRRALAHVSGLGQYELFVNGRKAGDDVLSPGWTNYRTTILYDTRDVTGLLREGSNTVGLSLGNGMAHVERPEGRFAKFKGSFGPQRAILQLRLDYADGTSETVATDENWKCHPGPITFSSIYGGEDHDARRLPAGWNLPGFDDTSWTQAVRYAEPQGALRGMAYAAEPVAPIETIAVSARTELRPGVVLFDFGRNLSFMPRVRISGPRGSVVRLTGGELVNADGTINRSTMGGAHRGSAWWQYTKATDADEEWFPQFYYLGSRYIHAEAMPASEGGALPKVESIEMVVVHSTARSVGSFSSSDPVLNNIRSLVREAQRSNMVSILTDCPHREKLGWLEQNHLNGPALRYEWALDRLAAKNMRDMAEAQTADGLIPNIAPEYTVFKGAYRAAAEWGASFIQVPWQQYVFTGDDSLLREHYEAMKRYFAYLDGKATGGVLEEGLGDWYDITLEKPGRANLTPPALTATAHFFSDAVTLGKIARHLGHEEEAGRFEAKAQEIGASFNRAFFKRGTTEVYGTGSQASLALPLALGLVEPTERAAVLQALLSDIKTRGHFSTGAIATPYLFRCLTEAGHEELVYRLVSNPDIPGYAFQLRNGNTSLAESWNALPGASQNHFFLGTILEWFYRDLAGITPDEKEPGFRHTIIRPRPVTGIDWAEATHDTPQGPLRVRWEQSGENFRLSAEIPTNARATVYLPVRPGARVQWNGRNVAEPGAGGGYPVTSGPQIFECFR